MRSPATARSSSPRTTPPTSMPSCWARGSSRRSVGASSGSARRSSSRGRSWGISRVTAACTRSTDRGRTSRRTGWPSGSSTRAMCCSSSPKAHAAPTERCRRAGTGSRRSALRTGAPIVPVGIAGSDRVWPRGQRLPHPGGRVTVRVGSPFRLADVLPPDVAKGDAKAQATDLIMRRIAALLPDRQRGVYRA